VTLEDLMQVARSVRLPTLRKDFIVDPIQVYEAKAAGASAILLIVRALSDEKLQSLAALARNIGLDTLVEVHAPNELPRALTAEPSAIGVNARDLETLVIDPVAIADILAAVPRTIPAVSESGLKTRADVERAARHGADAVLVGTALAGSGDPGAALKELLGVPRVERAG
jgi:indole-3-glycerol phosphate synthase